MKDSYAALIAVSIGILFAGALAVPIFLSGSQNGSPFIGGMMSTQGQIIPADQAVQMMKSVPNMQI